MQFEKEPIATDKKIWLIDALSACGFKSIEVTSFAHPGRVPQMADAEEVASRFQRFPGVKYTCVYINAQGLRRALATKRLDVEGVLYGNASEAFCQRNTRKTIEQSYADIEEQVKVFKEHDIPTRTVAVMASFGCNFQGDVLPSQTLDVVARLMSIAERNGYATTTIALADTMAWATPNAVRRMVGLIRNRWPNHTLRLHLHDTRGMGMANAFAAMEMGVTDFDSAVAGLGGCPFGGFSKSAGNISSEELVHMCHESGVETGIDLEKLIEVAREAETIVGHDLPSRLPRGGSLAAYRARASALA
jgi:hydroxymethylglutaryl-CoA lyase